MVEGASRSTFAAGIVVAVFFVLVLPASAQPIPSGMHYIPVYNYIENIEDFPDYRFISATYDILNKTTVTGFVTEDGMIPTVSTRFCSNLVYSVPKAAINVSDELVCTMSSEEFSVFLESSGAKKVASGFPHGGWVPDLSTEVSVTHYYYIDLGLTLKGTRTVVTHGLQDVHIVLIVLPIVGLTGIVAILAKRRRR